MSEIKPVSSIKTWNETAKEQPIEKRGIINNQMIWMQQEIDELRAAYETLQAKTKELEIAAKYAEHIDATLENQRETMLYDTLIERDALKAENEAQAKRIAELESIDEKQLEEILFEVTDGLATHNLRFCMLDSINHILKRSSSKNGE